MTCLSEPGGRGGGVLNVSFRGEVRPALTRDQASFFFLRCPEKTGLRKKREPDRRLAQPLKT